MNIITIFALAALLGVGLTVGMVALWRRRRLAEDALGRGLIVSPTPFDPAMAAGTVVCVAGVLEGPLGTTVVAWSNEPPLPAPEGLALRTGGARLLFQGRIEVAVGSHESLPAPASALARRLRLTNAPNGAGLHAVRIVHVGDRVVVRGKLVHAPDAASASYRARSEGLALEGFDERQWIQIAHVRSPVLVGLSLFARVWPVVLGILLGTSMVVIVPRTHAPPPAPIVVRDRIPDDPPSAPVICSRNADSLFTNGKLELVTPAERVDVTGDRPRCALREAEALLAGHFYQRAAAAVRRYETLLGDASPHDVERQEGLECLSLVLASRTDGREGTRELDDSALRRLDTLKSRRAMCRVVYADRYPADTRVATLGNLDFVWGDAQGMEFAKGPSRAVGAALLAELGASHVPAGEGKYATYPDAFLAMNASDAGRGSYYKGVFELGNDVGFMEWSTRHSLDDKPYAIFAALETRGLLAGKYTDDFRMDAFGNLALFLAAHGDADGARRIAKQLADIPDAKPDPPRWQRPSVRRLDEAIEQLASGGEPVIMRGEILGALSAAAARVRVGDASAKPAVDALRAATLDREIAVPLYFLETYARR